MIETIDIQNFRCFERLQIGGCKRINIVVGDNSSGKTSLLEAIFITLCAGASPIIRMHQLRGLDHPIQGTQHALEEAIWSDFFSDLDTRRTITIQLGGHGPERRTLIITRGSRSEAPLRLDEQDSAAGPFEFTWFDKDGIPRTVRPSVTRALSRKDDTGEDLPDFFFFAASQQIGAVENAQRFSDLEAFGRERQFVDTFKREYQWIEDLRIGVRAGSPVIQAKVRGVQRRLSLANASGAVNRLVNVLLAIASRPRSVVLVDEIENGVFFEHHQANAAALISFARNFDGQLFLTTHSLEWLSAFSAAADGSTEDIAFWKLSHGAAGPEIEQFSGGILTESVKIGDPRA